jgi:predicted DNA-binding protein
MQSVVYVSENLNTTVTVDEDTRRRLKRLAATLDETQGSIVRKALALYETRLKGRSVQRRVSRRVAQELKKASTTIRKKDPKWAMVSEVMEQDAMSIEEFSPAVWGRED